jgi:hypothetical protein
MFLVLQFADKYPLHCCRKLDFYLDALLDCPESVPLSLAITVLGLSVLYTYAVDN